MSAPKARATLIALLTVAAALPGLAQEENGASRSIRVIEKVPEASGAGQTDRSPGQVRNDPAPAAAPTSPALASPTLAPPALAPPAAAAAPPALSTPSTAAAPPAAPALPVKPAPGVAAPLPAAPVSPPTETAKLPVPGTGPSLQANPSAPVNSTTKGSPPPSATPALPAPSPVVVTFIGKDRFSVGDTITVQVRSQVPGYLVLVDVSSDGRISQIYPNVYSMAASGSDAANGNFIKAGELVQVPDASSPMANFDYLAGPPFGEGRLFAILSDKPVQYIDLPDLPQEVKGEQVASYVQQATRSLRITPAGDGPLLDPRWSFGVAKYVVEARTTQTKP